MEKPALYNHISEECLISILLQDIKHLELVEQILQPDTFHHPVFKAVYEAIIKLHHRGSLVNIITVEAFLGKELSNLIGSSTPFDFLKDISAEKHLSFAISVKDYAQTIADLSLRRQVVSLCHDTEEDVNNLKSDELVSHKLEKLEKKLYALSEHGTTHLGLISFEDSLKGCMENIQEAYKNDGGITGITSGFQVIDNLTGGFHPSELTIIGARPAMGKTVLAVNIAYNAARAFALNEKHGAKTLIFSMEMSPEELSMRVLASLANIPASEMRKGKITATQFTHLNEKWREFDQTPIFIDPNPGLTIASMHRSARKYQRQHAIGLIVVDYLQLMSGSSQARNNGRLQEISEISRGLKNMAKDLNIPVIALSQLSRNLENREDKRPHLSDLRESGSIEQDADLVLFIHREEYYEVAKQPTDNPIKHQEWVQKMGNLHGKAEIIVAKNRHGPIETLALKFNGKHSRFEN